MMVPSGWKAMTRLQTELSISWSWEAFPGVVLLASHDHEMLSSVCNRVIAFQPDGTIVDRYGTYDEYLYWMEQQKEKVK